MTMNDDDLAVILRKFDLEPDRSWSLGNLTGPRFPSYLRKAHLFLESGIEWFADEELLIESFKKYFAEKKFHDFLRCSLREIISINNHIYETSNLKLPALGELALKNNITDLYLIIAEEYCCWPPDGNDEDDIKQEDYDEFIFEKVEEIKWTLSTLVLGSSLFLLQAYLERMLGKACNLLEDKGLSTEFCYAPSRRSLVDQMLEHIASCTDFSIQSEPSKRLLFALRVGRNKFAHGSWEELDIALRGMTLSVAVSVCTDLTFEVASAIFKEYKNQSARP
jgi:hypothetical protein